MDEHDIRTHQGGSSMENNNIKQIERKKTQLKPMLLIFLVLFTDLIAFTIILPLFPSIIEHFTEKDRNSTEKDATLEIIKNLMEWLKVSLRMPDKKRYNAVLIGGILGSLFSFLQFISSPFIGAMSDGFGRKSVLILSMIGTSCSYLLWGYSNTFSIFLLSRIVGGLSKGSATLCTAMITDITEKENRGKGMAFIGLAFSFGFITGPLIGAYFATQHSISGTDGMDGMDFSRPAQIALCFQILSIFLACITKESLQKPSHHSTLERVYRAARLINPIVLLRLKDNTHHKNSSAIKRVTLVYFSYLLLFSGLEFTVTFVTHERFGFTGMQQGRLFFFTGLIMMVVQGGYVRRVKHNREKTIALQGIFAIIPAMLLVSVASSVKLIYLSFTLYSFGAATVVPCLNSILTQQVNEEETGENVGLLRSSGALARAIAPTVTCFVYWSVGSSICYTIGGLLFVIPLLLLFTAKLNEVDKKEN